MCIRDSVEDRAIKYVAKAADGSMRDALSLLDQCIAFYLGKELKYENVLDVLGAVDTEVFSKMYKTCLLYTSASSFLALLRSLYHMPCVAFPRIRSFEETSK